MSATYSQSLFKNYIAGARGNYVADRATVLEQSLRFLVPFGAVKHALAKVAVPKLKFWNSLCRLLGLGVGPVLQTSDRDGRVFGVDRESALLNAANRWVQEAIPEVKESLLFPMTGAHKDNGMEFIRPFGRLPRGRILCALSRMTSSTSRFWTRHICRGVWNSTLGRRGAALTTRTTWQRSCPCYAAQTSYDAVRKTVGCFRFDTEVECAALAELRQWKAAQTPAMPDDRRAMRALEQRRVVRVCWPDMDYASLPVWQHKNLILDALKDSQVVVVESPTGSGKTTALPVILNEAGFARQGMIGVTQPRRIAAISVSEFIARQLGVKVSTLVGYKMRFADLTSPGTKIKIMTDGILLQEMKLDPWLSRYDVLMVDEAHERSLTIDFILGLLKRVLEARAEFKVIVSSATINAQVFSAYFSDCPVVKIDAISYPVTVVYDPPAVGVVAERADSHGERRRFADKPGSAQAEALLDKCAGIVERVVGEKRPGDVLIFLPGEKLIKDCMARLLGGHSGRKLHIVPLYGRLGKEEQERVFEKAPWGKVKVVIATNIAETSVTIDGITTVIDSGLSKLNFYNPRTFTSSLVEGPISKASCNQRKGRAGRTRAGTCYRLYTRKDYEARPLFTTEEIYRTDLSEVVLRMADLGITDFEQFDFISAPGREGLVGAVETLNLLGALEADNTLSRTGRMMTEFPLAPRQSRIIVEAILRYPDVVSETVVAAAFLSTQSPYVLPPGEETDARRAHHSFRDERGDFVSYLKIYRAYGEAADKKRFCERYYLDERAMAEIANVVEQLELIVSKIGAPLLSGGPVDHYLTAVARGMIQFVCARQERELYRSLTAERILIHPGSVMFKSDPQYIVAGEIVHTARTYASSVSPLTREIIETLSADGSAESASPAEGRKARGVGSLLKRLGEGRGRRGEGERPKRERQSAREFTNTIKIAGEVFGIETVKGRKYALLPWSRLRVIKDSAAEVLYKGLRGRVIVDEKYTLFENETLTLVLSLVSTLDIDGARSRQWPRHKTFNSTRDLPALAEALSHLCQPAPWKERQDAQGSGLIRLGFIFLSTDGKGAYRFQCSRGFHSALAESLSSVEALIDELGEDVDLNLKTPVNQCYRRLSDYLG